MHCVGLCSDYCIRVPSRADGHYFATGKDSAGSRNAGTYTYTYIYTYTWDYTNTRLIQTYIIYTAYIHTFMHTVWKHKHRCILIYIHICIHTCIHTYIHTYIQYLRNTYMGSNVTVCPFVVQESYLRNTYIQIRIQV